MVEHPLLHAEGLSQSRFGRPILQGIDLDLARGDVVGLLGPNGAGKSTTMKILAGVLVPDAGTVTIGGRDLYRSPRAVRRRIGYLPQLLPLHPDSTVAEYFDFRARLYALPSSARREAMDRALAQFKLEPVRDRLIGNLSQGYQQRTAIAGTTLHGPDVLILDEPTNGLDPNQVREVRARVGELSTRCAIVISTHILSEVESLCSRVCILHNGRRVHTGPVATDLEDTYFAVTREDDAA